MTENYKKGVKESLKYMDMYLDACLGRDNSILSVKIKESKDRLKTSLKHHDITKIEYKKKDQELFLYFIEKTKQIESLKT